MIRISKWQPLCNASTDFAVQGLYGKNICGLGGVEEILSVAGDDFREKTGGQNFVNSAKCVLLKFESAQTCALPVRSQRTA